MLQAHRDYSAICFCLHKVACFLAPAGVSSSLIMVLHSQAADPPSDPQAASATFARVSRELAEAAASSAAAAAHPAPDAQADQQQAMLRARALAVRNCANTRCSNLAGASEAAFRGRTCGGCHIVRYCDVACSKADWGRHKLACRALQRQAAANLQQEAGA